MADFLKNIYELHTYKNAFSFNDSSDSNYNMSVKLASNTATIKLNNITTGIEYILLSNKSFKYSVYENNYNISFSDNNLPKDIYLYNASGLNISFSGNPQTTYRAGDKGSYRHIGTDFKSLEDIESLNVSGDLYSKNITDTSGASSYSITSLNVKENQKINTDSFTGIISKFGYYLENNGPDGSKKLRYGDENTNIYISYKDNEYLLISEESEDGLDETRTDISYFGVDVPNHIKEFVEDASAKAVKVIHKSDGSISMTFNEITDL